MIRERLLIKFNLKDYLIKFDVGSYYRPAFNVEIFLGVHKMYCVVTKTLPVTEVMV